MTTKLKQYKFIYMLGPSASGKTYTVKNSLLGQSISGLDATPLPDIGIAFDGGDMREASLVYKNSIDEHGLDTYSKIFKNSAASVPLARSSMVAIDMKKKIKPLFLQHIANILFKGTSCNYSQQEKIPRYMKKEVELPSYKNRLLCTAIKTAGSEVKNCTDNPCETINKIQQPSSELCFIIVDTLTSGNLTKKTQYHSVISDKLREAELRQPETQIHQVQIHQTPEDKVIFVLNLCPMSICKIQGISRQEEEGKTYDSRNWENSVNNGFDVLKNNINDNDCIIFLNLGYVYGDSIDVESMIQKSEISRYLNTNLIGNDRTTIDSIKEEWERLSNEIDDFVRYFESSFERVNSSNAGGGIKTNNKKQKKTKQTTKNQKTKKQKNKKKQNKQKNKTNKKTKQTKKQNKQNKQKNKTNKKTKQTKKQNKQKNKTNKKTKKQKN